MSANFGHLEALSPELHRLGVLAERFFADDANTSLIKSRQFGEYMVKEIAALSGVYDAAARETTYDLLRRLATQQVLPKEVADIFHAVRKSGNEATHSLAGSPAEALAALKFCRSLGVWYRRTYGRDPAFKPGPFVPPKASLEVDQATQSELAALRRQVQEAEAQLAAAHASADELAQARAAADELARQAAADSAVWEQTAVELEANQAALSRKLAELQKAAENQPLQLQMEFKQAGLQAASRLELDERQTRRLIDVQLVDAGWEADSDQLTYQKGARPEAGRSIAIAEWPSDGGRADYALFVGLICIGVIEAKREAVDVPSTLQQAERYARTIDLSSEHSHPDGPWQHGLAEPFRVPFVLATNGRPFVRQWKTKSGIWFCDLRRDTNHPRPLTKAITTLREAGIKVALTTGFSRSTQDKLLVALGWKTLADLTLSPAEAGRGRPYPDLILTALLKLSIDDVHQIAVLGDTSNDVLSGIRSGASIVAGTLTGAHDEQQLRDAGATHIVPSVTEFAELLTHS